MRIDIPKFVPTSEEYQKTQGSYVVNGGVINCTCGSLKNIVKLIVEDRGSDAGGSPICMDIDTQAMNFSQHFGKCSKTGKDCVLTSMNKKWHIPAKVPAYIKWIPAPKPRGKYTVADTNLVTPVQIYPVILESSLVCWHSGSAGLITIEKNGQTSNPFEKNVNDNPLTGGAITADPIIWDMVLQYISEYGPVVGLALVVAYFGEDYVNYIINNPPQNVLGRSLPKTQANAPTLSSRPTQKEYDVWYYYYYGANVNDIPRDNHSSTENEDDFRARDKDRAGSSRDLLNEDRSVKRRRYYDENGWAEKDVDYNHTDDGTHTFPHEHEWDWSKSPPRQDSR